MTGWPDSADGASLDDRVVEFLAERPGRVAFNGLRRALDAHPESLVRSLRRLERHGVVRHDSDGYALSGTVPGPSPGPRHHQSFAEVTLIPGVARTDLFGRLAGRWFGRLRWVGVYEPSDGPWLVWSVEGRPGRPSRVGNPRGRLLVQNRPRTGRPRQWPGGGRRAASSPDAIDALAQRNRAGPVLPTIAAAPPMLARNTPDNKSERGPSSAFGRLGGDARRFHPERDGSNLTERAEVGHNRARLLGSRWPCTATWGHRLAQPWTGVAPTSPTTQRAREVPESAGLANRRRVDPFGIEALARVVEDQPICRVAEDGHVVAGRRTKDCIPARGGGQGRAGAYRTWRSPRGWVRVPRRGHRRAARPPRETPGL